MCWQVHPCHFYTWMPPTLKLNMFRCAWNKLYLWNCIVWCLQPWWMLFRNIKNTKCGGVVTGIMITTIHFVVDWWGLPFTVDYIVFRQGSFQSHHLSAGWQGLLCILKVTIRDHKFQTSLFFQTPRLFCIFTENSTVITYLYNNSLGNSIFLEREKILCCWEFNIAGDN